MTAFLRKAGVVDDPGFDRTAAFDDRQGQLLDPAENPLIRPRRVGDEMQQRLVLGRDPGRCRYRRDWLEALAFARQQQAQAIINPSYIRALKITPGNTADSTVLDAMTRHLAGKLYADKGDIGRELFHKLWRRGLHLITSIRRNMRNYLMPLADKVMLRKRFLIETVLDTLKSEMGLEYSRHRSPVNAMVHILSCLVSYAFRPGKPSISLTAQQITAYP